MSIASFYGTIPVPSVLKQPRVNQQIRAKEIRVLTEDGENLGLLPLADALKAAEDRNADLIEISPNAVPPVGKIMDFGKYQYLESKKNREIKQKSHTTETKSVQIRIETGENDMLLKAKKTAEWLREGHRVKVDLFLKGRYKYMEFNFLKERLERFIKIIPEEYKLAIPIEKSPKGLSTVVERVKVKKS